MKIATQVNPADRGFNNGLTRNGVDRNYGALSPATFRLGGVDYTIAALAVATGGDNEGIWLAAPGVADDDRADFQNLVLEIGGHEVPVTGVGSGTRKLVFGTRPTALNDSTYQSTLVLGATATVCLRTSSQTCPTGSITADTTAPVLQTATVNGDELRLVYDEGLSRNSDPAATSYTVVAAGRTIAVSTSLADRSTAQVGGIDQANSHKMVILSLASRVAVGQTVTVSYEVPTSNPVQNVAGLSAAALSSQAVTNNTPGPLLRTATVSGTTLVLTYDRELDGGEEPPTGNFEVKVTSRDSTEGTRSVSDVTVSGRTVTLTLSATVLRTDTVTVSYLAPSADTDEELQDTAGNLAATFDDLATTNTTRNMAPEFPTATTARSVPENSAAGTDVGAPVTATDVEGDVLAYSLGGADASSFLIDSVSGQIRTRAGATYDHEAKPSHTVTVRANDGRGGTGAITVTIAVTDTDESPARPAAPTATSTPGSTTSLDVSWTAPGLNGGPALTGYELRYRAGTSGPWTAHAHSGTGTRATIPGLATDVVHQIQVRALNDELPSDWSEPGTGRPGNEAPAFPAATLERSIAENPAADATVGAAIPAATDPEGDPLAYALEGADADSFSFDASIRQIRTAAGVSYDHEAKSSYTVTVTADDRVGGIGIVTVTVRITDVDEKPATPAAPSVTPAEGAEPGLDVSWTEPGRNGGPALTGYELRYCPGSASECAGAEDFTAWPHAGVLRTATIMQLKPNTLYQVQVRALNGELPSDWSEPGEGRTRADSSAALLRAWLARFGRTVAGHVAEAVEQRLLAPPAAEASLGVSGASAESALVSGALQALAGEMETDGRRMFAESSFVLPLASGGNRDWTAWGRSAYTEFDGAEGGLDLDGEVWTGTVGLDWERGRWRLGLALSHSEGDGEAHPEEGGRHDLESTLTGVHPYARWQMRGGLSAWGVLGWGEGELESRVGGERSETDLEMRMAAFGLEGPLGTVETARGTFDLALKSDVLAVRTKADEDADLPEVTANAQRVRVRLEGAGRYGLKSGGTLAPTLEAGMRWDEGDAETGLGAEVGAALRYADGSGRLSAELSARGLLAHEESAYDEWGVAGAVVLQPDAAGRGLSLRLESSRGATRSGTDELWNRRDLAGVAREYGTAPAGRFEAELGYALNGPDGRGTLVPYAGYQRDASGRRWRLGARLEVGDELRLRLQGVGGDEPSLEMQGALRW